MFVVIGLLATFGSYALASLVFFYNPDLIHKREKRKWLKKIRHISHRGGAGENLENSMAAFRHAINVGTDMLELDCHLTKDNQVVVSHDANLLRVTGLSASIQDLEFTELPCLKRKLVIDFDPGQVFSGPEDATEVHRIPLLSQVFDEFPDVPINIDVKDGSVDLIRQVSKLVSKYQREEITVWGNFREEAVTRCYNENPDIGLFFSMTGVAKLLLYFYTGLLPFIRFRETHLEIFLPEIFLKKQGIHGVRLTRPWRWFVWLVSKLMMRPALFQHLEKRGIQTYLWVLNTEEEFQTAVDLGVTGIMTDYPTKLRNFYSRINYN